MTPLTPALLTSPLVEGQLYVTVGSYKDATGEGTDVIQKDRRLIVKIEKVGDLHLSQDAAFIDPAYRAKGTLQRNPNKVIYYTEDGRTQDTPGIAAYAIADLYTPEKYPDAI